MSSSLSYCCSSYSVWTGSSCCSAPIDTGAPTKVIINKDLHVADGLAVDWIYNHVYWTDTAQNLISVADLDGKNRKALFSEDLDEPRAIVVNPLEG